MDGAIKTGSMRLGRSLSHGVDGGLDLIAVSQSVKRREARQTSVHRSVMVNLLRPFTSAMPDAVDVVLSSRQPATV